VSLTHDRALSAVFDAPEVTTRMLQEIIQDTRMLQEIVQDIASRGETALGSSSTAMLKKKLRKKFSTLSVESINGTIDQLVADLPERIELKPCNISFKKYEHIPGKYELDISRKGIKERTPNQRSFRDPQRHFFDVAFSTIVLLKVLYYQREARFATVGAFLDTFPAFSPDHPVPPPPGNDKATRDYAKMLKGVDLEDERVCCNVVDVISQLHGAERKAYKTRCIHVAAAVAGDCCGYLGG
jgi:hypothetical protein